MALTNAERQERARQRRAEEALRWKRALEAILKAKTVREAREIAASALAT